LAHGHEVVLFSITQPPGEFKDCEWVPGNINHAADCLKAMEGKGIEAVHNVAALPDPTDWVGWEGHDDPAVYPLTMQTNIVGLYNMLQAAVRSGVGTFVNTGSNCVYGHGYRVTGRPFEIKYLPIDEDHPSDIEDSYSFSKRTGEQLLEMYVKAYGLRCYSLRPGYIVNESARNDIKNGGEEMGELLEWLSAWVAAEDLAAAHRLLMEQAGSIVPFGCYNCMSDDTMFLRPTMDVLKSHRPDLIPLIREPLKNCASLFSSNRLKAVVGWRPAISWR
jgi:nucleoside-diphosphate-sugar epimerase